MKPIIFSTDMVKAILEGRKTQTRRLIKPQPEIVAVSMGRFSGQWKIKPSTDQLWVNYPSVGMIYNDMVYACPYGKIGDRLWVRETYWTGIQTPGMPTYITYKGGGIRQKNVPPDWKPQTTGMHASIHMPRWASRLELEIVGIRVQRLQDISEADVKAEGVLLQGAGNRVYLNLTQKYPPISYIPAGSFDKGLYTGDTAELYKAHFASLWDNIHAKQSSSRMQRLCIEPTYLWHDNPYVWVIEFKPVRMV